LQETNWLPGASVVEMNELVKFFEQVGIGMGGPDLIPDKERAQERPRIPAYSLFSRYAGRIALASNVEAPQYMGHVGNKIIGTLTPKGIYDMGRDTLKLNYFFWATCDWKSLSFTFTGDVLPMLKDKHAVEDLCPGNLRPCGE
jgi:hypothetical protein